MEARPIPCSLSEMMGTGDNYGVRDTALPPNSLTLRLIRMDFHQSQLYTVDQKPVEATSETLITPRGDLKFPRLPLLSFSYWGSTVGKKITKSNL